MRSRRQFLLCLFAAPAAALLVSCSSTAQPAGTDSLEYGWIQPSPLGLPVQTALDQGFFEQSDLDVATLALKSGPELVAGVISDSANVAIVPTDGALGAMSTGQDLVALGPFVKMNLDLVANPDSVDGAEVASLKGKVIGVTALGAITERFARVVLEEAGLDPDKDVTFLAVGVGPSALAAFQHGQVDAMVQTPSANVRFADAGSEVVVLASSAEGTAGEIGIQGLTGFNVASREFVDAHPEVISAWCEAMSQSVDWLQDPANRADAVGELASVIALDPALADESYDAEVATWMMSITSEQWAYNLELSGASGDLKFDDVVHNCE